MHQSKIGDLLYTYRFAIIAPCIIATSAIITTNALRLTNQNQLQMWDFTQNSQQVSYMQEFVVSMDSILHSVPAEVDLIQESDITENAAKALTSVPYSFYTGNTELMLEALELSTTRKSATELLSTTFDMPVTGTIQADDVWNVTGATQMCFTYMGWQLITNTRSQQYKWRQELFPEWDATYGSEEAFDEEGFGKVDGRYVVATSASKDGGLAYVGQCLDVVLTDGTVIPCIVGDIKSSKDANWTVFGHMSSSSSICIIEFIVDKEMWYNTGHANPGRPSCKPEWSSPLDHIILY